MNNLLKPGIDYIAICTPFYCVNENGELLLHKRSNNCRDEKGRWDTGSGQLEFGETPEVSVLREVKEEYGCSGEILETLPAISVLRRMKSKNTHWLALPFVIKVRRDEVRINEPEKIDELGWFRLDDLPKPLHSALKDHIINTERIKYLKQYLHS